MTKAQKNKANKEWMRLYRATPEGRTATKLAKQKRYQTEEGRRVKQEGKLRWKRSERGKKTSREWAKRRYVPSTRILLSPEEKKERTRLSNLKSTSRPEYQAKKRATAWRGHLLRAYGLKVEQYNEMANSGCQICGEPDKLEKRLHVDHDHDTGQVRGLLCDPCNRGLGCFRDDPLRLNNAIIYLRAAV